MDDHAFRINEAAMRGQQAYQFGMKDPRVENVSDAKRALEARASVIRKHLAEVPAHEEELRRIEAMLAADSKYAEK